MCNYKNMSMTSMNIRDHEKHSEEKKLEQLLCSTGLVKEQKEAAAFKLFLPKRPVIFEK